MSASMSHVLYIDHEGHPAPLSQCYHATASRRLASSIDRHPPSTITEVDSAYCPQCLSFHDAATAATLGHCPRPTCKRCPICTAVASVTVLETSNTCFYRCGYCSWTSQQCNVTTTVIPADDGTIGKDQLTKATDDLGAALQAKISDLNSEADTHYPTMLGAWESIAKAEVRHKATPGGTKLKKGVIQEEEWSVDALEQSIRNKRDKAIAATRSIVGGQVLEKLSLEQTPSKLDESLESVPTSCLAMQALVSSATPTSQMDLLPLPMPLRSRKSRRCRKELAEGRPGILVKPKLNPLEGDSSLRSGHGQWWKKDSSAIHVLPKVQVVRQGKEGMTRQFLLKVTNPTLGIIRLKLGPSTYAGEPTSKGGVSTLLKHVLVDSLLRTHVNISLACTATSALEATELIELESMEDSFLELGKAQVQQPDAVTAWQPSHTGDKASSKLRWIASRTETAWFELTVPEQSTEDDSHAAVPITLQIQVGEGSWESSLVKPLQVDGPDLVTFDILITWK